MYNQFRVEKIAEDGTKFEIRITLMDKKFRLDDIGVKPKGKRKFDYVCGSSMTNDYSYRILNMEDRRKYEMLKMLEVCSIDLINEAIKEAWMQLKPEKLTL